MNQVKSAIKPKSGLIRVQCASIHEAMNFSIECDSRYSIVFFFCVISKGKKKCYLGVADLAWSVIDDRSMK
jgi:hypothetical protein